MSSGIGDVLRTAREQQGRTVEEAARSLRVRPEYVEALELEAFDVFGADTYARGHLRNYAKYLGLDPDPLSAAFSKHVAGGEPSPRHLAAAPVTPASRQPAPAWVVWSIAAVVVLIVIVLIGQAFGGRTPPPANLEDIPQPTVSPSASGLPSATASPSASPTVSYDGVHLLLAFDAASWLEVVVDGTTVVTGEVVSAGDTRIYDADEDVVVRFGNAGGVLVELNGENLGLAGESGQVVRIRFTRNGPERP